MCAITFNLPQTKTEYVRNIIHDLDAALFTTISPEISKKEKL